MAHDPHHEHLIKEIAEMFAPLFAKSPQAIYLYLDDEHKICNTKFAKLVGYKSVQEWVENQFPVSDVDEKDRERVIKAYYQASRKLVTQSLTATVVTKTGKKIKTEVIMAPITYRGEVFVLHFISPKK